MAIEAGLSAAEAFLLMSLPDYQLGKALKLGFMGLVAQGILQLEIEDRRGLFRTRQIPHLYVAGDLPSPLPPGAAALVNVVRDAEPGGAITDVLAGCRRAFGSTLLGVVRNWLGPALVARGLAEPYRRRVLGIFPVPTFACTAAGAAEKTRLLRLLQDARSIPDYLDRDPVQAVALVAALGGAILLVDELRPHYAALARAMRGVEGGGDTSVITDIGGFAGDVDFGSCDFGSIDFSCFDSGAFDSFDAGFSDAGGGDGGGDGGGGDGGGSSC